MIFGLENSNERINNHRLLALAVSGAYTCQFSKANLRNEETNITVYVTPVSFVFFSWYPRAHARAHVYYLAIIIYACGKLPV